MSFNRYNRDRILRLFPYINNKTQFNKLKIDNDSIAYITPKEFAEKISQIIISHVFKLEMEPENIIITDATAGVGGNTISFAKYFKHVHAIELDKERAEFLENNLSIYNITNTTVYNYNCLTCTPNILDHNIIFIDPPWGGKGYKTHKKLRLKIDDLDIETICNNFMNSELMKKVPDLLILKLPINYDIKYLYDLVKGCRMYLYELDKMIVIVIEKI
ncbi:MAG: putative RNA methylase [Edafosvirus sp.]|uniref:Putative RNA methylase n=1 Tax=Edafosvirus sp. TaxID=2487765 RepID=A0A3G4ZU65_9VIRU|nr:MAG: putative RNA methylase [Edafosvirus sp.]